MLSSIVAPLVFALAAVSPPAIMYLGLWWYLYSKQLEIDDFQLEEEDLEW